jgi:hypothetical protein
MSLRLLLAATLLFCGHLSAQSSGTPVGAFGDAPHNYWTEPDDAFSKFRARVESGQLKLDASRGEKQFIIDLLKELDVPASSQLWVYSGTSLQSGRINPRNPRAVYFNEEIYVGYVPGGQMEIASIDPERGAVFYIFDIPRPGETVRFQRSEKCMNCHAGDAQYKVPGLAVESVIPGPNTGSLDAYRRGLSGHGIPLEERFGGWHVTGAPSSLNHQGNATGALSGGKVNLTPLLPGAQFDVERYPVATSDILAHLIFEHQVGFTNRVTEARYLTRAALAAGKGRLRNEDVKALEAKADALARYLMFAEEAPLPREGIEGDSAYKADFLRNRKAGPDGSSLKDLDLRTRLFKHRCSYMLYSRVFTTLQPEFKKLVYARLSVALGEASTSRDFNYLPVTERRAIRNIVSATLPKS